MWLKVTLKLVGNNTNTGRINDRFGAAPHSQFLNFWLFNQLHLPLERPLLPCPHSAWPKILACCLSSSVRLWWLLKKPGIFLEFDVQVISLRRVLGRKEGLVMWTPPRTYLNIWSTKALENLSYLSLLPAMWNPPCWPVLTTPQVKMAGARKEWVRFLTTWSVLKANAGLPMGIHRAPEARVPDSSQWARQWMAGRPITWTEG